jgi:hypothetical protein
MDHAIYRTGLFVYLAVLAVTVAHICAGTVI